MTQSDKERTRERKTICLCFLAILWIVSLPCAYYTPVFSPEKVCTFFYHVLSVLISYFAFRGIFRDSDIGILCTALYNLSIYRIYLLYISGTFRGKIMFLVLPFVLYAIYILINKNKSKKDWIVILAGLAVLLFLLAWHVIPFVKHISNIGEMQALMLEGLIQKKGLYPAQLAFHFWTFGGNEMQGEGMQYSYPMGVGFVLIVALATVLVFWFSGVLEMYTKRQRIFYKTITLMSTLLLWMSLVYFPWDRIAMTSQTMQAFAGYIGHPVKCLGIATVLLVVLCGFILAHLKCCGKSWVYYAAVVSVLACIVTSGIFTQEQVCKMQNNEKLVLYISEENAS